MMGGVENAPKKALTLQLQGGSPSNMDQYTLEHLCTKFGAFITMWTILPKSTILLGVFLVRLNLYW